MIRKLFFCLLMLMPLAGMAKTANVRWCTFNIRLINDEDNKAGWGWEVRRSRVAHYVTDNDMDVVGMREVTYPQLTYLQQNLPGYNYIGVGRHDGKTQGEYSCIWYKTSKFEVLDSGNFWLSETPDSVGSKGWDAALERIATWGKFRDKKTGKIFMAVNTHFDHVGVEARKQSALLIIQKIRDIVGNRPAVVTGDFNIDDKNEAYTTITTNKFVLRDAFKVSPSHGGVDYTFQNFSRTPASQCPKIDFIFVTPQIEVIRTGIPANDGNYIISDHNPHWADLQF